MKLKQVIIEYPETDLVTFVDVEDIDEHKYYGIQCGKNKGFVTCTGYYSECKQPKFITRTTAALTTGDGWSNEANTLEKLIAGLLRQGGYYVYEFNTFKQLAAWLVKEV